MSNTNHRTNRQIRMPKIQLIDQNGKNHGTINTRFAMDLAEKAGLDLVEISPSSKPPVCKIMNYGQYKYQQKKNNKGKKSKQTKTKDIRLRPNTAKHDLDVLLKRAKSFLEKGNKVFFQVRFRGRELRHTEMGTESLKYFIDELKECSKIEVPIRRDGKNMNLLLAPDGE